MDVINAIIVRCRSPHKMSLSNATRKAVMISLKATRWPHWQMQQGCSEGVWVSQQYSSHNNKYCCKGVNYCKACATNANCNIPLTSTGVKGRTLDTTTATIVTVSMANGSSTSTATMAVAATTSATTRRVSPAYMASMPITCMTSAMLICTTKCANYNIKHKQQQRKKQSHCDMFALRHVHDDHCTSSISSCLAEPVKPFLVTKTSASNDNKKIPFL